MDSKYTDTQLKQALAKMLSQYQGKSLEPHPDGCLCLLDNEAHEFRKVLDTELLQLCWEVEETLIKERNSDTMFGNEVVYYEHLLGIIFTSGKTVRNYHATWQQRVIALAQVKEVEIV